MANPHAQLPPVSTTAGTWSVWLAVGSFLVGILYGLWGIFFMLPQWGRTGGGPSYDAQLNVGNAVFSVAVIVLAIAAVVSAVISIRAAKPFPRGQAGRKAALVRGWIGLCLGTLFIVEVLRRAIATIG